MVHHVMHLHFICVHWKRPKSLDPQKQGFTYTVKKGVLQLALQFNFRVAKDTYNSLYLYIGSANGQVTWVAKLQFTIYIMQLITTQLQFNQNNSFSTIMQLHYNCTHDVMLTSLIVIHLMKSNTWHYEDFWT